jgi:hypothetical protein
MVARGIIQLRLVSPNSPGLTDIALVSAEAQARDKHWNLVKDRLASAKYLQQFATLAITGHNYGRPLVPGTA